jgi:hypothetical protein
VASTAAATKYDFPVISEGDDVGTHDTWEATKPDGYEKGAKVGRVTMTRKGGGNDEVHFTFNDAKANWLTATGTLPDDLSSAGSWRFRIDKGDGKFKGKTGSVVMQSKNPKRWSIEGG